MNGGLCYLLDCWVFWVLCVCGKTEPSEQTPWHDWFGNLFKVSLIPTGLDVETDVPVMKKLPEADIVIIRRSGTKWTKDQLKYLPDGIRQTRAKHV
jgi:hypothetical protein